MNESQRGDMTKRRVSTLRAKKGKNVVHPKHPTSPLLEHRKDSNLVVFIYRFDCFVFYNSISCLSKWTYKQANCQSVSGKVYIIRWHKPCSMRTDNKNRHTFTNKSSYIFYATFLAFYI